MNDPIEVAEVCDLCHGRGYQEEGFDVEECPDCLGSGIRLEQDGLL